MSDSYYRWEPALWLVHPQEWVLTLERPSVSQKWPLSKSGKIYNWSFLPHTAFYIAILFSPGPRFLETLSLLSPENVFLDSTRHTGWNAMALLDQQTFNLNNGLQWMVMGHVYVNKSLKCSRKVCSLHTQGSHNRCGIIDAGLYIWTKKTLKLSASAYTQLHKLGLSASNWHSPSPPTFWGMGLFWQLGM